MRGLCFLGLRADWRILGARDLNNEGVNDLVAGDAGGTLWLYEGTNNPQVHCRSRIRVGGGQNACNLMFS